MNPTAKIIPKEGLIVRDPITRSPLSENGEIKSMNKYWRRRLNDGSVTISNKKIPIKKDKNIKIVDVIEKSTRGGK